MIRRVYRFEQRGYEPDGLLRRLSAMYPRLCMVLGTVAPNVDEQCSILIHQGRSERHDLPRARHARLYGRIRDDDSPETTLAYIEADWRALDEVMRNWRKRVREILVRERAAPGQGLLIHGRWLEQIVRGTKTWELRGSKTAVRGLIGLIEAGAKRVVGTAVVRDVVGPLSVAQLRRATDRHGVPSAELGRVLPYRRTYAWVLADSRRLRRPVRYEHPPGAVIWVKLPPGVSRRIRASLAARRRPRWLALKTVEQERTATSTR
jgi:hypothetical protein